MADFADVDTLAARYQERGGQPGLAYGIVVGGELVHAVGLGERYLGGTRPDAGTVFRIASMTKSFTASAILALRDDGALRLDDPAEAYVPELRGWPPVGADSALVSLRHLLTMTAGFPVDDPWADRQQGMPLEEFGKFLSGGVRFNWAPGTRFEYSNLGYAILGRVITAVTGADYQDYIRDLLLRPLGMTGTGFEAAEFDVSALARGYRRVGPGSGGEGPSPGSGGSRRVVPSGEHSWSEVELAPYGAFAPIGGVFSCVRDLARWVAGFAAAFPPGDPQAGGPHPVRRATRREMQLPQVLTGWDKPVGFPGEVAPVPSAYGFGLFVEDDPVLGRVVSHSGGYPGFGSNMRWHPASGIGVIALGNSTYAAMMTLSGRLLDTVMRHREPPTYGYGVALAPAWAPWAPWVPWAPPWAPRAPRAPWAPSAQGSRGAAPWPETLAARDAVSGLLRSWDDAEATRLFSPNVAQDAPFGERRQAIALIRERIGDFRDDDRRPHEFDTPAHCRWWLAGERGVVQAQIQLNPERPPRVLSLTLAVPPAAGSPLHDTLDAVVGWLNGTERDWPPSVPVDDTVDASLLARRLRMAAAWAGEFRLGAYKSGDGRASVAVELVGEHATLTLTLAANPASGLLRQADVCP
jgi:CubicO group peptidase (beta-lactamase class C family)